jgi:hypothetical protein
MPYCQKVSKVYFFKGRSTSTALINFWGNVYKTPDDKEACVGIFLGLLTASDLLNRNILLQKLHTYGVKRNTHHWFVA